MAHFLALPRGVPRGRYLRAGRGARRGLVDRGAGRAGHGATLGLPLAAGALATVYSTAMIYRSLAAVPRWSSPWVPVNYLTLAAASGAVWLAFVAVFFDPETAAGFAGVRRRAPRACRHHQGGVLAGDRPPSPGRARSRAPPASPPRTGMRGCAFSIRRTRSPTGCNGRWATGVARRHARKLRALTWALAFVLPAALCLAVGLGGGVGGGTAAPAAALGLAVVSASAGVLIERWLFFAEAEHKMALYYGTRGARDA